jgi:CP family cyanate transporter-like MFS transporter
MARLGAGLVLAGGLIRVWSPGFWPLVLGIALVGAGVGVIFPILPKVARETAPPEKREAAAAFYTAALVAGAAMGVALSAGLAALIPEVPLAGGGAGWRGGYLIWAAALLVTFCLWEVVGARAEEAGAGAEEAEEGGEAGDDSFSPWRSRPVWAVTAALFVNNVIFYTGIGWFPSILKVKGWPLDQAALIVSLVAWLGAFAVLTAHKIAPLIGGVVRLAAICTLATAAILAALPSLGAGPAAAAVVLAGLSMNLWFVLCMAYPARAVPAGMAGQAGGMIIGLGYFGGFVGPWAAGAIRDAAGDFAPALYALAALVVASLITAPSFGRRAG